MFDGQAHHLPVVAGEDGGDFALVLVPNIQNYQIRIVEMVEVGGELRVQPVEITRKRIHTELDEIFRQVDEVRDLSLSVSSDEEAIEVANKEIQSRRRKKTR